MPVPVVAFFNNKGGVGKTSLVYHLAWMCSDLGHPVLAVDLDPQANLTAAFLDEERLETLWNADRGGGTLYDAVYPLIEGSGDVAQYPHVESVQMDLFSESLFLLPGDLRLSDFESSLADTWSKALDGDPRAFRVQSAFWRLMQGAAERQDAEIILMDLGPNLGAINRSALISADFVLVPLSPDLFSLQGLRNLGPTLSRWRREWNDRSERKPGGVKFSLPQGRIEPLGYVVLQHSVRLDRPVKSYSKWIERVPLAYRRDVLSEEPSSVPPMESDPHCLKLLKHYRSLMPMAQEARKPIFHLKAADGAIGSHFHGAQDARKDFGELALTLLREVQRRL